MPFGKKISMDKVYIDGVMYEGVKDVEFSSEQKPFVILDGLREATFTTTVKSPLKVKLKWKWEQFKVRRNSKKLAKLLRKTGFIIEMDKGDAQ